MSAPVCVSRAQQCDSVRRGPELILQPPPCLHDVIRQSHNDTVFDVTQATGDTRLSHDDGTGESVIPGAHYHSACQGTATESKDPAYSAILFCFFCDQMGIVFSRQTRKNWWLHTLSLLLDWLWREFCKNSKQQLLPGSNRNPT